LFVHEAGAAYDDDVDAEGEVHDDGRVAWLDGHLRAARAAIDDGVDLRGFFVWSLLDNFEWAHGYSRRFGLVFVDYPTLARVPKQSFYWYRDLIASQRAQAAAA
ncbi:MAG TPA: family 1 glycosylhydrolase, partial [Gaiellaceae bacterium]